MKCPKCQFDNPEDSVFCGKCGSSLEIEVTCQNCSSKVPKGFMFCNKCGQDLREPKTTPPSDLSFDEKINKIQRYLPKGLTEKILSQRDRIEGERKQVTVMFCDMEGFTQLAGRVGPEEAYTIMDQVYEILIHKVHDYEGTVNEFTGDGIMALFGAPIALEDAPQRAIRTAHAIHREIAKLSGKMKQEKQNTPPVKMRIGIHTGLVVVGTLGNDLRVEFKAVGDTVNMASRMEGLAEPGSTNVSEDTFKLTEGLFRYEALGEYAVKGKEEPVKIYRVIAPSTSRTRFDVSAERGLTPFVGRERELEIMLDCFERSKTGKGQAISIMGEAGVGKSRLLYEFRKAVSNEDVTIQEGKCLSYSRGVAYHPIIDIVKPNFDIKEGDGDFEIREKIKRGLKVLGADEVSTLPYLLEFLSVKDSGVDKISLSPEARKERIIESLKRIFLKASQIRPLIFAVEDLHWIDKSSEDTLKASLNSIAGEKVFMIFTYRPEYVHTWGAKSYHSQITLNRLSNRESLSMVTHLLETENIGSDLEQLILEKTEGVPFFIEEFIKSLKDLKIIERTDSTYHLVPDIEEVTIPSTIQDVIMARVDTLPEGAKDLLQTGSVIEREFSHEVIRQISGLSEQELLSRLSILKDSELIFERGIYPESSYIFKHALTQEVVYDSILTARKKKLHDRIGQAIEKLYKYNLHEHYVILAEHFISSENYEKGAEYCNVAGRKAEKAGSLADGVALGYKEVACLERLLQTDEVEKNLIDARTKIGFYYFQLGQIDKAKKTIDPITEPALKRNYKKRISQIFCILGVYKSAVDEDFPKALDYLNKSLKIGDESNYLPSIVLSNGMLGLFRLSNLEFPKTLHYFEKALKINVAANALWGISAMKSWIALFHVVEGKINIGYDTSNEAVSVANHSGDNYSKSHAYCVHGWSNYRKGYLEKAEEYFLKATVIPEKDYQSFFAGFASFGLGMVYFQTQEYEKSKKNYESAISIYQGGRFYPSWVNCFKLALALTKLMNNENDMKVNEIFKCYDDIKINWCKVEALRCVSEILLNIGNQHISEAEDWINKTVEAHKKYSMMWNLASDYALYTELFKRKGEKPKAKESLCKAIEIFKECGADGWVDKYEKELAALQ